MSSLLEGLSGVVCQMDDVLIYGSDQETHDRRVHTALQKLEAAGVTLNPAKCNHFCPHYNQTDHDRKLPLTSLSGMEPHTY